LGILDSKAKVGDYNAGTGPYVVKTGTTPTTTSIDLAAYASYWGGHVSTREVKLNVYNDPSQLVKDAKSGKLDLAGDFNTDQMSQIKPVKTLQVADEGTSFIGLNTTKAGSPLQSLAARQAVADALNIPAILEAGKLQGTQASQLVPVLLPGHNAAIESIPYNVNKAKTALSSVSNATAPLTFAYPSSDSLQMDEAVKNLEAAGFTIKPMPVDDLTTLTNDAASGKYDMYSYTYDSSFQDGQDILSGVLEDNQDYTNPQIDSLLTQTGNTLDQASRIQLMQKVATIVNTDKPVIPMYVLNRPYAITKPYVIKSDMPGMVTGVYFWKVYQQ